MRQYLLILFATMSFFASAQDYYLFIGTYTGSGSKGIYVYRFNTATGSATWVSNTDSSSNPSYLAVTGNGKYLYAVNETNGENPGKVSAYAFDRATGKLRFINQQLSGGDDPCYVSVNKSNKWAVVANYSGGSVAALPVNEDGSLSPLSQVMQDEGTSKNTERQEKAHVHAAVLSPAQDYLFTPDLGTDKVMTYRFTPADEKPLQPATPAFTTITPGAGPRHFTFHPNKKIAYLIEELSGTVGVYKYMAGKLTLLQQIAAHPANYKGTPGSADIHLSPDARFLYASNRGEENNLAIFSVDATGKLKSKGYQSTKGKTPRNFIIDPTGNYLLVANQNTDNIVIFKRNKETGLLTPTGRQIKVPKPVCLQLLK